MTLTMSPTSSSTSSPTAPPPSSSQSPPASPMAVTAIKTPKPSFNTPVGVAAHLQLGKVLEELLAGSVAGAAAVTVVYPLDTLKTRLQTYRGAQGLAAREALARVIRADGPLSLYRGLLSPIAGYGLIKAVGFASYGWAVRVVSEAEHGAQLSAPELLMCGALSGLAQAPLRQVLERVKIVMQARELPGGHSPYRWSGACAMDLIRREGLYGGLFRGMSATFLREAMQLAFYYPTYDLAKRYLRPADADPSEHLSVPRTLLAGGIAGVSQWLPPMYYLDVLKTRMSNALPGQFTGIVDCARNLYQEGGFAAYHRGLGMALLRALPLHAMVFVTYEWVMMFFWGR